MTVSYLFTYLSSPVSKWSSRMLKKSARIVLASLRGSTYRSVRLASSPAAALLGPRRVLARQGWAGRSLAFLSILRYGQPCPLPFGDTSTPQGERDNDSVRG